MQKILLLIISNIFLHHLFVLPAAPRISKDTKEKADAQIAMTQALFEPFNTQEDGTCQAQATVEISYPDLNDKTAKEDIESFLQIHMPHILLKIKEESIDFLRAKKILSCKRRIPAASKLRIKLGMQEHSFALTPCQVAHDMDSPVPAGYHADVAKTDDITYQLFCTKSSAKK